MSVGKVEGSTLIHSTPQDLQLPILSNSFPVNSYYDGHSMGSRNKLKCINPTIAMG